MDANGLHLLLLLFIFAIYFLGLAYLLRRRTSFAAFALWGLLAMFLPALGPFLVIVFRPGSPAAQPR
jgi:hypothetical protein